MSVRHFCPRGHGVVDAWPCEQCQRAKRADYSKRGKQADRKRGRKWTAMRRQVIRNFGGRCAAIRDGVRCSGVIGLQVHHVDGDPANNDPANLVPLCGKPCHVEFDGRPREDFAQPDPVLVVG